MQPTPPDGGILGRVTARKNRGNLREAAPLRKLAVGVGLSALLLAGCGGDDDPEVDDTTSASEETGTPTTDDSQATTMPADDADVTTGGPDDSASTTLPPDDAQSTTGAAPEGGPVTSADQAFTITPPEGWLDVTDQVEQDVEIALRDDVKTDEFFTNLVVASEEPIGDLEQSIEAAAEQVAGADGEYELVDPVEIDGEEAFGFVLTRTTSGVEVAQTQWWVEHGDRLYVATFSSAKTQEDATRPVMEEVLGTWSWDG